MLVVTIRPGRPLMAAGAHGDYLISQSQEISTRSSNSFRSASRTCAFISSRVRFKRSAWAAWGNEWRRVHEPGFAAKRRMAIGFPREKQEKTLIKAAFLGYIRLW